MGSRPFWEAAYQEGDSADAICRQASSEFTELVELLPPGACVLDLGCGDGRNALYLAKRGCRVLGVDVSAAGIAKLDRLAKRESLNIETVKADLREYVIPGRFDLIVAHGCLHLLEREAWLRVIREMQEHTRNGGYNVVAVFTDTLEIPEDLRPFAVGLFKDRELFGLYDASWERLREESYVFSDEHPGEIRHTHACNKLVVRKKAD